jgi:glycosyltransferase involved in cell wall biosynthesis
VTPSAAILPPRLPRARVIELEWGADTERFTPGAAGRVPFTKEPGAIVAVFAGAFRAWHGAIQLVDAVRQLHERGLDAFRAVFLGDGPERPGAMAAAAGDPRFVFAGAVSHDEMPAALAAADIGVAPFDVARHPPLALGFYWSPLKVFEYMASGLPVVAPALPRLRDLVGDAVEGRLYEPATSEALADALATLADPGRRAQLGAAARARAVRDYSWEAHCRALDRAFRELR